MTREEFRALLLPLVIAMRAEFDTPAWTVYFKALEDVPPAIIQVMVEAEIRVAHEFFPKAGELRAWCEKHRRVLLALHPWSPCAECEGSPRWRAVLVDGVERVQKCPCIARHQQQLTDLGVGKVISALPNTAGEGPAVQDYPTLNELPSDLRDQARLVASQKVLR